MSRPLAVALGAAPSAVLLAVACTSLAGCDAPAPPGGTPSAPQPMTDFSAARDYDPDWSARPRSSKPMPSALPPSGDPRAGRFTLQDATAGMPKEGKLVATIVTGMGELSCELWPDKAPNTVANFIGLANGTREWKTPDGWRATPAYDGSSIDRVTPGVAIVGGELAGGDSVAPGYRIADEAYSGMRHGRAGLLCTRGHSSDAVGSRFLITDGAAPNLDARRGGPKRPAFTVFGECKPLDLIHRIASVAADHGRPKKKIAIERIRVKRIER